MIEKLSGVKPWLLASFSICLPNHPVPSAVAAVVTDTYSPGLFRWRIFAAAVASGEPQVWPSFVPPYPPIDTLTSPPLPRIRPITLAASVSDETGRVPSQVGLHPPPLGARMNAS